MNLLPHESAAELIGLLHEGLRRRGFHFLSGDELNRLWTPNAPFGVKREQLRALAQACGAKFEADARFTTARFVPLKKSRTSKSQTPVPFSDLAAWSARAEETARIAA